MFGQDCHLVSTITHRRRRKYNLIKIRNIFYQFLSDFLLLVEYVMSVAI